jgi:hypothetical protein
LRGEVRRVKNKDEMSDKEDFNNKATTEAVQWCANLKTEFTGLSFARKIGNQTYSFDASIEVLSKHGGAWPFYRRIATVWGEFLIMVVGDEFLGQELQAQREATQSVHDLLAAEAQEGEQRGLTMMGMAPSSRPRKTATPSTFNVGGGGNRETTPRLLKVERPTPLRPRRLLGVCE